MWIVTGGIGTGKSTFCEVLLRLAGERMLGFSADQVVHAAYEQRSVRERLGLELGMASQPDLPGAEFRKLVRAEVARNSTKRAIVESVLHPMVREAQLSAKEAAGRGGKVLLAEIPLYYETGAAVSADRVIVVAASQVTQLLRLQSSRSLDSRTAEDMLKMQLSLESKIERADVVIWNDGSDGALEGQAALLLRQDNILN